MSQVRSPSLLLKSRPYFDSTSTLSPSLQALERRIKPVPPPRSLSFFSIAVADFWLRDQIPLPKIKPQTNIEKLREREPDTCPYQSYEGSVLDKQQDDWLQYVFKLEKEDGQQDDDDEGRRQSVYQCRYEGDRGQLCNYLGLKQMVKRHVNSVHLKIRPWACQFCSKRFPQKSSLQIHTHTLHTGEKPIKCPYCPIKFADPARRHKHVARFHSDKPTKRRRKAPFCSSHKQVNPG